MDINCLALSKYEMFTNFTELHTEMWLVEFYLQLTEKKFTKLHRSLACTYVEGQVSGIHAQGSWNVISSAADFSFVPYEVSLIGMWE